jgi:hypothetical protein
MFSASPGGSYPPSEEHMYISKIDEDNQVTTSDQRTGNLLPLPSSSGLHDQLASQAEEDLLCITPHIIAGYPDSVSVLECSQSCYSICSLPTTRRSNSSISCVGPQPVAVKPYPSTVSLNSVASSISASTCRTFYLLSRSSSDDTIGALSCAESVSLINFSSSDQPTPTHGSSRPVPRRESGPIVVESGDSLSRIVSHKSRVGLGSRPVQRAEAVDEPMDHGQANILSATVRTADVRVKKPLRPKRHRTAIVTA